MNDIPANIQFVKKQDGVYLRSGDGGEEKLVRLFWARPISGQGEEIAVVNEKKEEILMIGGLDALEGESRVIVAEELEKRYLIPKVVRVLGAHPRFGSYYGEVITDHGRRRFVMKDPGKNITWITDDHLILRDTLGNRFAIESLKALDLRSRQEMEKIL
jgi:hypothetical protein